MEPIKLKQENARLKQQVWELEDLYKQKGPFIANLEAKLVNLEQQVQTVTSMRWSIMRNTRYSSLEKALVLTTLYSYGWRKILLFERG